jgi:hypothetical protein
MDFRAPWIAQADLSDLGGRRRRPASALVNKIPVLFQVESYNSPVSCNGVFPLVHNLQTSLTIIRVAPCWDDERYEEWE